MSPFMEQLYVISLIFTFSVLISAQPLNLTLLNITNGTLNFNVTDFNMTNSTINNTIFPWEFTTTNEFQTSFEYFTLDPSFDPSIQPTVNPSVDPTIYPTHSPIPILPNDTIIIDVILNFKYDNNSLINDQLLLTQLTDIFYSLLNSTLNENGYPNTENNQFLYLYLYPISTVNNTNINHSNLYLTWNIYLSLINETDQEIIIIISEYISSPKFIKQYNINILNEGLNEMIQLFKLQFMEIHPPIIQISTTSETDTDIDTSTTFMYTDYKDNNTEYVLPQHLREYMLLYAILFCILSLTILCSICWCFTVKCFEIDKFNKDGGASKSYNDLNLSTKVSSKDIGIEIDDDSDDAEFVMKAYDDDEQLKLKYKKNINMSHEEIQMISTNNNDNNDEYLTLKQKMDIQNAFDEE